MIMMMMMMIKEVIGSYSIKHTFNIKKSNVVKLPNNYAIWYRIHYVLEFFKK